MRAKIKTAYNAKFSNFLQHLSREYEMSYGNSLFITIQLFQYPIVILVCILKF